MTPDAIGQIVRRLGKRVGVDLSTHSLRRFFCMTMYDSKTGEFVIQRKMRHSSTRSLPTTTCTWIRGRWLWPTI